jgi:hypothetical protein
MIVYGGYIDNGSVNDELLNFDLEESYWYKVNCAKPIEGLAFSSCATLINKKLKDDQTKTRS